IWITQSYDLANTIMLLLIGRLSDIFGRVKIYTVGFAIFTIGSGLTSLGTNATEVIAFRALQGIGAALIFTNSIAIITDTAPKKQLGFFLGINQIAFRAGAMLGLTISGVILSFLDWRALFYINIPIGIIGTIWAHRQLRETALADKNARIDWLGFITFTGFLLCIMIALTFSAYGTSDLTTVYGLFAASALFLAIFGYWETKSKSPLIDLRLFRVREVTGGVLSMLFNIMSWTAVLLLLSLQFQLVLGETPLNAGLRILPFELAFLALGPLSGTLADKFRPAILIITGLSLSTISLFLLSTTNQTTSYTVLSLYMILLGAGTGLFVAPNLRAMLSAVPINRRGIGSALFTLFLNIGFTVSLNLAIVIMSLTIPYSLITNLISTANPATITAADKMLFANSLKTTYFVLGIINAIAIAPALLQISRKTKPKQDVEPIIAAEG
ncbi:MAG TPA: MFS transporter, partial [Candidatus Nanoarchaeia archaeon]|nr:MFS transporter [Candidatus Nanoarchaeia archaeon]